MNIKWWQICIFALVVLAVAVIIFPTNFRTGWMFKESYFLDEAIQKFEQAIEEDPSNHRTIRELAQTLHLRGEIDKADDYFKRMIALRESDFNYRLLIQYYHWTEQTDRLQETYANWMKYKESKGISFDDEEGRKILRDLYSSYLQSQDYEKAIEILEQIRKTETEEEAYQNKWDLVILHEKAGHLDETTKLLQDEIVAGNNDPLYINKFLNLAKISGKVDIAKNILIREIKSEPDDENNWTKLIEFESRLKNFSLADLWYDRWLENSPDNWTIKKNYVKWLMGQERTEKALAYLEGLLKEPAPDPYFQKTLYTLYEWHNRTDKLLPIYETEFKRNPRNQENSKKLLNLAYDSGDLALAESVLTELHRLYPGNTLYAKELAEMQMGRYDEVAAISTLEATARSVEDPAILKQLGEHYMWESFGTTENTTDEKTGRF